MPVSQRNVGTGGVTRIGEEWKMSPRMFGRVSPPSMFCRRTSRPSTNLIRSVPQSCSVLYACRDVDASPTQKSELTPDSFM